MLSIRRTLSCLAVGAFAAAALLRGPVAAADAPVVIHESFPSKVATFWPSFIAQAQGFYTNQGLQVEDLVVDPNVTVATLIGGSVEVSFADSTQLLLALEKGANLVAVGIETDKNPYKLMAPAGIKTLKDLKGKRIGVASAIDVYTYVAREILRKAGLDPEKDVEWIVGGGQNQRLSAIAAGAIQAGFFTPPSDSKLTAQGFNTLAFAPDYFPDLTLSATTVKRDWALAHPDVLRKFLQAQSDAVKWLYAPANHARAVADSAAGDELERRGGRGRVHLLCRQARLSGQCVRDASGARERRQDHAHDRSGQNADGWRRPQIHRRPMVPEMKCRLVGTDARADARALLMECNAC